MNVKKIDKIKYGRPIKILDLAFIVGLVMLSIFALLFLFNKKGESVQVWKQGTLIKTVSLNQNTQLHLDIYDGHLLIVIENGAVWVEEADCPDQICKKTGKISRVNQTIVCAPYNVFLRVIGESDLDILN
ncbi:MAG: NusG domain II-containing protein [Clostridiales bacterium]|jgi:hypothetical protein|nr:NusG domain II-containing protein [Clostridiales bacterium]